LVYAINKLLVQELAVMNRVKIGFLFVLLFVNLLFIDKGQAKEACLFEQVGTDNPRLQILFDADWRFHLGDVEGGEKEQLDDTCWRSVDLPHDWSIEDLPGRDCPIAPEAIGGISTGYSVGGTGWYRKNFTVVSGLQGKRFCLEFDGAYMNADVWLNGQHLGNHPYGYTSFWYDITDKVKFDAENILAVEVKNEGRNSRWYSGSGIYRHVWLMVTEPVHVVHRGSCITTPEVSDSAATIQVKTNVVNSSGKPIRVNVVTSIVDKKGIKVAQVRTAQTEQKVEANGSSEFIQSVKLKSPELWSTESPVLYTAVTEIFEEAGSEGTCLLDRVETKFGIRSIEFGPRGFFLNGKNVLLKGGCMHHDNGPLGSAAYDRAEERRVELMKASGFNAIRTAHNPPSTAFLDACDRLGVLVIDEAFDMWRKQKNSQDYHLYFDKWWKKDLNSMVLRDRNHPSVIMWSIGNEIPERGEPEGIELAQMLADYIRELDPTRPVTAGVNGVEPDKDPYFAALDVCGYNYSTGPSKDDHERLPERVIYASESTPLDAFEYWMVVLNHPWVIGYFVWTGFDYLGEASIGWKGYPHKGSFYPWMHAFCGDIDICGFKRPQSYYRDVLWKNGRKVSIFVKPPEPSFEPNPERKHWSKWHWHDVVADWNWTGYENQNLEVEVYCALDEVELFVNGKSLGKKQTNRETEWLARWQVPYQPGVLKAVGYGGSKEKASRELRTADKPSQIRLSADRTQILANGQDLSYITVGVLDSDGVRHPKADNLIEFEVEGPGSIVAVGSSNPMGTESFQRPRRKAYHGRCLVIVKSEVETGTVVLKASSEGLQAAQVAITTSN
jgi:beta-galactosidase